MEQQEILELYKKLRKEKDEVYHRVLPLNELLVDRWEKASYLKFKEGSSIYDSAIVLGEVQVGKNTWIGPNVLLDGSGETIVIGDDCNISAGVHVYTHDTVKACVSGNMDLKQKGKVFIGNNCYIGPKAVLTLGISIGDRSIVATNSFVNRSFPENSIIGGTPAKKLGEVIIDGDEVILNYNR